MRAAAGARRLLLMRRHCPAWGRRTRGTGSRWGSLRMVGGRRWTAAREGGRAGRRWRRRRRGCTGCRGEGRTGGAGRETEDRGLRTWRAGMSKRREGRRRGIEYEGHEAGREEGGKASRPTGGMGERGQTNARLLGQIQSSSNGLDGRAEKEGGQLARAVDLSSSTDR